MTDTTGSLNRKTHYFVHRYEKSGKKAPLPKGKHTMICDVYECDRGPRTGESAEAYLRYAIQSGKIVRTSDETHMVE